MSPLAKEQPDVTGFDAEEEKWFAESNERQPKRPLRTPPTTRPPPPIGDPLADSWFR